jgi:serine/threonine protein kinase
MRYCNHHDAINVQGGSPHIHPITLWPILPDQMIASISFGVLMALAEIHKLGWGHFDIKLDNILMNTGIVPVGEGSEAFLGDFGFAQQVDEDGFCSVLDGTANYEAPELRPPPKGRLVPRRVTPAADMWAFGVCLYCMAVGDFPFPHWAEGARRHWKCVERAEYDLGRVPNPQLQSLIEQLLRAEPTQRLSAEEALNSHFVQQDRGLRAMRAQGELAPADAQPDEDGVADVPLNV